ncbi:hypothetical protein PTKIN_Ptkin12aG0187200 [Pterospermum kingtungense]
METKPRTLEITVLSGEDLRVDNKSVKKKAFVTVSIDPFNYRTTKMDGEGGSYPRGTISSYCENNSDRFIGGYSPETCLQFLSYRLRDPKGLKNGIINVSVRVKEPLQACSSQAHHAAAATGLGIPIDGRKDFGVVTGIPIWGGCGYPSNYSLFR